MAFGQPLAYLVNELLLRLQVSVLRLHFLLLLPHDLLFRKLQRAEGAREGGGRSARPSPRREDRGGQINAPTRVEAASRASAPAHPWFVRRALASVYPSFARARSLAWSEGMRGCGARPEVRDDDDGTKMTRTGGLVVNSRAQEKRDHICSNRPARQKTSPLLARQNRGCGEVDTASASGAEDPEFESRHPHFFNFFASGTSRTTSSFERATLRVERRSMGAVVDVEARGGVLGC